MNTVKKQLAVVVSLMIILSCSFSQKDIRSQGEQSSAEFQIIKNIQLVTLSDSLLQKNRSIVLKDEIIHWIGKTKDLGAYTNAKIIDGKNNFVMPGLADMHVHIRSELELLSYLYYGVTTVLQMSGPNANIDLFTLRDNLKNGKVLGPDLYMAGPMLDGDPAIWSEPVSLAVGDARLAEKIVEDQNKSGYDFIKIYNRLSTPTFDAIMKAANQYKLTVIGHIPREPGALYAIQNGERMVAHMEEFFFSYFDCIKCGKDKLPDVNKIPELVKVASENDVWITPNLSFIAATRFQLNDLKKVIADPEFQFLSSRTRSSWMRFNPTTRNDLETFDARERVKYDFCKKLTLEFHLAGIPLLAGSDASASGMYPGKSLHLELNELSKAGLNNYEVLKAATSNPSKFIEGFSKNAGNKFGEIKVGNQADLLVLGTNPLKNIDFANHISKIISRGKILDRAEIDRMRIALRQE